MRNIGTATRTIGVAVAAVLMLAACELPDFNEPPAGSTAAAEAQQQAEEAVAFLDWAITSGCITADAPAPPRIDNAIDRLNDTLDDLTSALDEGAAIHGAAGRLRRTADTLRAAVREHCGLPKERTEQ